MKNRIVKLVEGESYTREQIGNLVGGSKQAYLPSNRGVITCACFLLERNPYAPHKVYPGLGKIQISSARYAVAQGNALPTFLKQGTNDWQYIGEWRAVRFEEVPPAGFPDRSGTLYMEEVR